MARHLQYAVERLLIPLHGCNQCPLRCIGGHELGHTQAVSVVETLEAWAREDGEEVVS